MITRGIKNDVDRFISELSAKYLPFKMKYPNEEGLKDCSIQVAVRPIQIWEIVFPEEHLSTMMKTLRGCEIQHKRHKKFYYMIRRMLGKDVKPIPTDWDKNALVMPLYAQNIEIAGIGIKKDYYMDGKGNRSDEKKEGYFEGL